MRKIAIALGLGLALVLGGCLAGPHQLRRSLDDFDQKLYVDSPIIDGILWFPIPAFGIANYVAWIGDFFIDGYHFWINDVWANEGAGFVHIEPQGNKQVYSLTRDDSEFITAKGGDAE